MGSGVATAIRDGLFFRSPENKQRAAVGSLQVRTHVANDRLGTLTLMLLKEVFGGSQVMIDLYLCCLAQAVERNVKCSRD